MKNDILPGTPFTERRVMAWIGRSVRIEGKVVSNEDLTIDGHVDGPIELANHSLAIGAGASIKGNLLAKNVTISGTVVGNVKANEKIDLRATGSVEGNLVTPRLVMADGAFIKGSVDASGS